MLQIKKVERFDLPSACSICGGDEFGEDPYKFTLSDGGVMITCDTCGENLACELGIDEKDIKKFEI